MAILIGVIALAVIPNIQRSRESKDLTTLDNLLSAANIAVANMQLSSDIAETTIYEYSSTNKNWTFKSVDTSFDTYFQQNFSGDVSLGSTNCDKKDIKIKITKGSTPKIEIGVTHATPTTAEEAVYTKAEDGTSLKRFYVSN